jgi:hypothetical protein
MRKTIPNPAELSTHHQVREQVITLLTNQAILSQHVPKCWCSITQVTQFLIRELQNPISFPLPLFVDSAIIDSENNNGSQAQDYEADLKAMSQQKFWTALLSIEVARHRAPRFPTQI